MTPSTGAVLFSAKTCVCAICLHGRPGIAEVSFQPKAAHAVPAFFRPPVPTLVAATASMAPAWPPPWLSPKRDSPMDRDIGVALAAGHFSEPPRQQDYRPGDPARRAGRPDFAWRPCRRPMGRCHRVKHDLNVQKLLSLCAGLAVGDGLFPISTRRSASWSTTAVDGPQNAAITWRHLLQLTSEWQGTCGTNRIPWIWPPASAAPGADTTRGRPAPCRRRAAIGNITTCA